MKRIFLLIVIPALLVALGFAQTPAASGNSDQINVKGCLGGSEGNYTVAEDNTGNIFKITTSSADLKAYVGQDINLTGHKEGTAENSLAVTALNMISEHCTAAAVAPAAAVSTTSETASTPPAAAAAPEATVSAAADTISTPVAAAPEGTPSAPAEAVSAPPALAADPSTAAPSATVSSPVEAASSPAAATPVHRAQPAARSQKPVATAAAAAAPSEPAGKPVPDAAVPVVPVDPPSETATTPAPPAAAPKTSAIRSAGMLVTIVVVLLIGAGVPLYNRWRRRRVAEETRGQNLSFTKEAKSDPGQSDTTGGRKAA